MTTAPVEEAPVSRTFFDTEHLKSDLKGRSVRGGAATVLGQGASFAIRTGSTMVLARLLTPADFGLIAMVTAVVGFAGLFKDLGLSMATVQRAEVNHGQISTLFWLNVALSAAIALVLAACAPIVAWFYGEPRLMLVTMALAGGLVLSGLMVQHQALIQRQMRFVALTVIQVLSMFLGVVAAITAGAFGAGYWALVIMPLTSTLVGVLGVWTVCRWRPGLPVRHSGVREMLKFGGNLTGFNVLNYFSRNLDNILIGWQCGALSLGWYAKAYGLLMLPITQINRPLSTVAIPALSALQREPQAYRRFYLKGVLLVGFVSVPIVLFSFAASDSIIRIMLGAQWHATIPIFRILVPAAFIGSFNVATGWVYVSLGRTDRQLKMGVVSSTATVVGFIVGIRWGVVGVACAFSAVQCLLLYPRVAYCFKGTPLKPSDLLALLWRPVVAALLACLAAFGAGHAVGGNVAPLVFMVKFGVFFVVYLCVWCLTPNGIQTLREILRTRRQFRVGRPKEEGIHA